VEEKELIQKLYYKYHNALINDVIPFWQKHSLDTEYGGYLTCLDFDGTVFDTDKFAWMQGRQIFMFSKLCSLYGVNEAWQQAAKLGLDFMLSYGKAASGDFYFALNRSGTPLVQPYNIFSDCFMCIALAAYSRIADSKLERDYYRQEVLRIYQRIQERTANPKGIWNKQVPDSRNLQAMSMPMIQAMMAIELEGIIDDALIENRIDESIDVFMNRHVDKKLKCVFERVCADGSHQFDIMEGRLLNPGHALETLWFLMVIAEKRQDNALIEELAEIMLWSIERGWDTTYGGIFYYRDYHNRPLDKLESDMKLWWVHAEALCALLLAWKLTGSEKHKEWFLKVDQWTWQHFPDSQHGEWYGYLSRQGEVALSLKGGKWKGFFHLPRMLYSCSAWLKEMGELV